MKVLILFAHPAFHKSRVNKVLVDGLSKKENVTFHDLYQEYPELDINVKREQELLSKHDIIIFQFPFFWYSTPSILKEWQDLVLEHGWAFGSKGNALKGKLFVCALTAGGPQSAYTETGFHNHTLNQLIAPLRQTSVLCKMKPLPPFVVYGTHAIETDEILDAKNDYMKLIAMLTEEQIDLEAISQFESLNDYMNKED